MDHRARPRIAPAPTAENHTHLDIGRRAPIERTEHLGSEAIHTTEAREAAAVAADRDDGESRLAAGRAAISSTVLQATCGSGSYPDMPVPCCCTGLRAEWNISRRFSISTAVNDDDRDGCTLPAFDLAPVANP